jgi:hypothetical protein
MTSNEPPPPRPEHPKPGVPVAAEPDDESPGYPLTARRVKALIPKEIG